MARSMGEILEKLEKLEERVERATRKGRAYVGLLRYVLAFIEHLRGQSSQRITKPPKLDEDYEELKRLAFAPEPEVE